LKKKGTSLNQILTLTSQIDITLTPQVGDSIAVAATIVGGPIIGAATWFANQVLSKTLFKHAGLIRYHVQGPWAKPQAQEVGS